MKSMIWLIPIVIAAFAGCKKDSQPHLSDVTLNLKYEADGNLLLPDTLLYLNDAGNLYSVNRLEYYISDITLRSSTGMQNRGEIFYVNAFSSATGSILIDAIPYSHYDQLSFHIGIKPSANITGFLPNTQENINMSWPDVMGGGYHFLKFEGFVLFNGSKLGYTMHLGNDSSLVKCSVPLNLSVSSPAVHLNMVMNLNEWFRSPHLYNIITDGNHIMGNQVLMSKIAQNGFNVFSIE